MSITAGPHGVSLGGVRSAARRLELVWPVLITALILTFMVGVRLSSAHGNPTTFVQFGRTEAQFIHPPSDALISSKFGYDGQLYWLQATDPLVRSATTRSELARGWPGYHLQRPGYPMAAWLLAGGQRSLLPWSLLAVNVISVLALTAAFVLYCRRRGWNPAWALAVGLAPGVLLPAIGDLSDVMATACLVIGLMCWERGRVLTAGALVALASLTREPTILAAVAFAVEILVRSWHLRSRRRAVGAMVMRRAPAVVIPVAAFVGWRLYISAIDTQAIHSVVSSGAGSGLWPPYANFLAAAHIALNQAPASRTAWILIYLGLTVAAMICGLLLLRRGASAIIVLGPLMSLVLGVIFLGDQWALTRYTAPTFIVLLLAGLEHRSRPALAICGSAAVMTVLLPMLI